MTVSYWQQTASETNDEAKGETREYDVCILGAGVAGASVAWWLKREAPDLRVAVIERKTIGAGASGRNAGMVLAGLADHYDSMVALYGRARAADVWEATLAHARLLKQFVEETNADVGYEPVGSWRVGMEAAEREHLARSAELLREDNFAARYEERDPMKRGFHGALCIDKDAAVHPLRLVKSLLKASHADVFEQTEAFAIENETSGVRLRTSRGDFLSQHVCLALNAYAPQFDSRFAKLVTPHRGQIFVTAPLSQRILARPVYTHHGYIYFRQLADYRLLLGGWRHEFAAAEEGYADMITDEVQNRLREFLRRYFPEAKDVTIDASWSGTMGFSPDGLPLVGKFSISKIIGDEKITNETIGDEMISGSDSPVSYLVGFTGHGFGLALEVARRAVRMILHNESSGVFDARRFNQIEGN